MNHLTTAAIAALAIAATPMAAFAQNLNLSHQWSTSDVRHEVAEVFATELANADVGLDVTIHEKGSLFKAREQYEPLKSGELDLTIYPLAYSGGERPQYSLTLMPGLVQNHDHALRLTESEFMDDIEALMAEDDVMVLAHGYLAGGFAGTNGCVTHPDDVKDTTARAAGAAFEAMVSGAGANIESMSSSKIYEAMEAGTLQVANTSSASFVSYEIYEQVTCFTPAGDYALWFMYMPLLMNKAKFDAMSPEQQTAVMEAGQAAQDYYFSEAAAQDSMARDVFQEKGVEIKEMSFDDYIAWFGVAKLTSYEAFLEDMPDGLALLDKALNVE
ncbi:TRAP transporter substrate-binding protein DctP [Aestuariibius insulae]|uniref:TRAP transporter substrate-binding protein DctP n=1 Tax=Aestuariibius insulae TaxID=2058287 RepID=UPI00345EFD6B